ncbi:UDP-N-acetylmuramoyl-L-alanyl-D-glutamate--2,6-diaminopimelate ligase [Bacillus sinesaloumensis]|uniref:UDP-N-acetylmuramoyl-L-alanyl-D-glutamate--2, 6-diaminopimelate ligase n=1 Tax=Litchfieldia sinesaloumensis TaxID=1926280 RepID=UPI00098871D1|nr:UDP-N-acetylmuramoyl-L-alanyl-D-glutamate--2,6-diaminopimelate ligase [Bacillus sinesaloumensis]
MRLKELTDKLLIKRIRNEQDTEITGVQYDSRKVESGHLFICLRGYTVDGHDFIDQAINQGAIALLVEEEVEVPGHITTIQVPDTRRAMAIIAETFYQSPTATLQVIGITGTNGKTTTSNIIQHILNHNQKPSGLIGTINIKYSDVVIESKNTTPDTLELQQLFDDMKKQKMSHVVMEVSSHALSLGRVRGTNFKTAIFTNLTQDHLDYHESMEEYANAKGLLFSGLTNESVAVLNNDDPISEKYSSITSAQVIKYGIDKETDVYATDIKLTPKGTTFTLHTFRGKAEVTTKLIGKFNVYNLLAAISACLVENIELEAIIKTIEQIDGVPGRFETVDAGQDFTVIVDYAHTPDSLENVLKTARQLSKGKITCVVGCGGNRDAGKRPIMASIAEQYSDYVFLTSDNPRKEDPLQILNDMEKGMEGKNYSKLVDRKQAIEEALSREATTKSKDDCVIIVGKGHETYQIIGDVTNHFDDREVAREFLQERIKRKDESIVQ